MNVDNKSRVSFQDLIPHTDIVSRNKGLIQTSSEASSTEIPAAIKSHRTTCGDKDEDDGDKLANNRLTTKARWGYGTPRWAHGRKTLHAKQTRPMRMVSVSVESSELRLRRGYMIATIEFRKTSSGMRCSVLDARLMTEQKSDMAVQLEANSPSGAISRGSTVDVDLSGRNNARGGYANRGSEHDEASRKNMGRDPEYNARPRSHLWHPCQPV